MKRRGDWTIQYLGCRTAILWGKARRVIKYQVIDENGVLSQPSEITEDRKAIKPGKISSTSAIGKWHLVTYQAEKDVYTFKDRHDVDERPFTLSKELIEFLDELAVEEILIGGEE